MSLEMPKRKRPPAEGEGSSLLAAREAVENSGEVVELLERASELVAEDDPAQPTTQHIYAALCEAETRRTTLDDWYARTYGENLETENGKLENGKLENGKLENGKLS